MLGNLDRICFDWTVRLVFADDSENPFQSITVECLSAAKYAGTCQVRSSSADPTNSSSTSNGPEAGSVSEAECGLVTDDRKNCLGLVAKSSLERHCI